MKKFLTTQLLEKYKPKLVVVFGNHGRKEARHAVHSILSRHTAVFHSSPDKIYKTLYEEIGGFWSALRAIFSDISFPHVLIVDAAQNDSTYHHLREILEFEAAITMPVGDIPSFSEFFAGEKVQAQKIAKEAKHAVHSIVCSDDETLRGVAEEAGVINHGFGFDNTADFHIDHSEFNLSSSDSDTNKSFLHIKVDHEGSVIPFTLSNCFGKRNIYAAAAALAAAKHFDINLVSAAQDVQTYETPIASMSVSDGIKDTVLFTHHTDVTPFSAREALEMLGYLRNQGSIKRGIVILGDVLLNREGEAESLHRTLGELAAHNSDLLYLAGNRVIFAEESARKHGMKEDNINKYTTVKKAARKAQGNAEVGDGILILGSDEINMEAAWKELRYI